MWNIIHEWSWYIIIGHFILFVFLMLLICIISRMQMHLWVHWKIQRKSWNKLYRKWMMTWLRCVKPQHRYISLAFTYAFVKHICWPPFHHTLVCVFIVKWLSLEFYHNSSSKRSFLISNFMFKVLASQKRMENKYKAAQQASEDW